MQAKQKPRIAILGATRGAHLVQRHWLPADMVTVAALCDLNRERTERENHVFREAGQPDVRLFDSAADMFDWGAFDAVLVATPDHTHADLAKDALHHGFHVFVEKPMTTTIDTARDLVTAWSATDRIGVAGHEFRYHKLILAARERIQRGDIGTPRLAMTVDSCGRMGSYWRRRRWRKSERPPANSLTLQKAIHQLDIQTFLVGDRPTRVFASGHEDHYGGKWPSDHRCSDCEEAETCPYHTSRIQINGRPNPLSAQDGLCVFSNDTELHDNQVVAIDYRGGARGSYVECFFTPDYKVEHTVIGDQGRVMLCYVVGAGAQQLEVTYIGSTRKEVITVDCIGGHGGGDNGLGQAFVKGVRDGVPVQPDLREGYYAVALAALIDASHRNGQPEPIPALETE